MPVGRGGDEEPGVVAPVLSLRRDPVREHLHATDVEHQVLGLEHVREAQRPGVQLGSLALEPGCAGSTSAPVVADRASSTPASSNVSRTPATQYPRPPSARPRCALADASSRSGQRARTRVGPVAGVHRATGEHVRTTDPVGVEVPAEHEDLQVGVVADQHHRGGFPRYHHRPRPLSTGDTEIRG